jgi:hypothetical protein
MLWIHRMTPGLGNRLCPGGDFFPGILHLARTLQTLWMTKGRLSWWQPAVAGFPSHVSACNFWKGIGLARDVKAMETRVREPAMVGQRKTVVANCDNKTARLAKTETASRILAEPDYRASRITGRAGLQGELDYRASWI